MPIDYSTLLPGQEISSQTYTLDSTAVSKYAEAVGDDSALCRDDDGRELVPPMAVAALSLRGVVNDLAIPGGTLHAGQELEFKNPVAVGEELACRATLLQNSVRGEWRFMVVRLDVEDGTGREVMAGKSTIMLPA
ncbi:MAG: MaoC family dehydratase [Chloroflexi bacterium]|nr:MaoC family dehydratase [Chloroflexota bacterium]